MSDKRPLVKRQIPTPPGWPIRDERKFEAAMAEVYVSIHDRQLEKARARAA